MQNRYLCTLWSQVPSSRDDCSEYLFDIEEVELATNSDVKQDKAASTGCVIAEHILFAHLAVILHLKNLRTGIQLFLNL